MPSYKRVLSTNEKSWNEKENLRDVKRILTITVMRARIHAFDFQGKKGCFTVYIFLIIADYYAAILYKEIAD